MNSIPRRKVIGENDPPHCCTVCSSVIVQVNRGVIHSFRGMVSARIRSAASATCLTYLRSAYKRIIYLIVLLITARKPGVDQGHSLVSLESRRSEGCSSPSLPSRAGGNEISIAYSGVVESATGSVRTLRVPVYPVLIARDLVVTIANQRAVFIKDVPIRAKASNWCFVRCCSC